MYKHSDVNNLVSLKSRPQLDLKWALHIVLKILFCAVNSLLKSVEFSKMVILYHNMDLINAYYMIVQVS